MATAKLCSIPGCGKPLVARTWCGAHYQRWRAHGDPLAVKMTERGEPRAFYLAALVHEDREDCLTWPFTTTNGRAMMYHDGRMRLVHRLICEEVHGAPPTQNHEAAHNCGKGHEACVNKHHLEWKTRVENQIDRVKHGTSNRGERAASAKLTERQAKEILRRSKSEKQCDLAREFGVHEGTVNGIVHGRYWGYLQQA